jgi:hypothetical protein
MVRLEYGAPDSEADARRKLSVCQAVDLHQVPLGERIAVDPGRTATGPEAAGRGIVAHAHDEREPTVVENVGQGSYEPRKPPKPNCASATLPNTRILTKVIFVTTPAHPLRVCMTVVQ